MPKFIYTAKPHPSKIIQGYIEAESLQDAVNKLTQAGCFPVSLKVEDPLLEKQGLLHFKQISKKEITLFTSQLSNLIGSGINIINALNIISGQNPNRYLKNMLSEILSSLKDGKSLSESFAVFPEIFPNLYYLMVRVGETSGNLKEVLKRLAGYLEEDEEFKNSLRASLVYPLFIFVISVLTVLVLFVFVIPRMVTMFEDMGQALPLSTRIIIALSNLLCNYWWLILAVSGVIIFLLRRIWRLEEGRLYWDRLKLKMPIFGVVILKAQISRLMRTMALLFSSGIPVTPSLEISASILENEVLKSEVLRFREEISSGLSLSDSFKSSEFFPELVTNIVAVGEETGDLERSLTRIADTYEKEVSGNLKTLTRLMEPVIILVMGLVVGFIVIAMLLPIFQINLIVK